ncbi:MAG: hypothetical protein IKA12_03705 [Clostridia bacterium]|nr:hypothetical protein [Clostridia bacterium]
MKKLNCVLNLNSEVEISKVPLNFFGINNTINELGKAVFKNTMLARAYLRLGSIIQQGRANIGAYIENPIITVYFEPKANNKTLLINLSCEIVEEINEDKILNYGDNKIN